MVFSRIFGSTTNMLQPYTYSSSSLLFKSVTGCNISKIKIFPFFDIGSRFMSFFIRRKASELWKASTSVSNQGRSRGRAKGLLKIKNLNRGQKLGFGKAKMSWPGLTQPIIDQNRKISKIGTISEDQFQKYEDGISELRALMNSRRGLLRRQTPLERGWTSASPQGKKFGPPISLNPDLKFENFDSILIEHKLVNHMTGKFGRVRRFSMLMVTGNRNGMAGFALGGAPAGRGRLNFQKVVNRAGLKLCFIQRYEDRTVYHDFFTQFGQTRMFVRQKPPGFGIVGHRAIVAICDLIGLKDLEVILEGSHNVNHMTKAFFLGLLRQKTHQVLANEKKLHLVELRGENDFYPKVVASPEDGIVRTKDEILPDEVLDFEMISFEGKLPFYRPPKPPSYLHTTSYKFLLKSKLSQKHHPSQRRQMLADYGRVASRFTDIFPECKPAEYKKPFHGAESETTVSS